jgi:CRP-like cAMP-binding protein
MVLLDELENVTFLQDLDREHLGQIALLGQLKELPGGSPVFREGQHSSCIFLLSKGHVALEMNVPGRGIIFTQTVGPGELLGWSPLLSHGPMTATAITLEPCRLIAIDAAQLLSLCEENAKFGIAFLRRTALALAERLYATRLQLESCGERNLRYDAESLPHLSRLERTSERLERTVVEDAL